MDKDLEERLYALIHHQEDDTAIPPSNFTDYDNQLQLSIDHDPINRRPAKSRYWAEGTGGVPYKRPVFRDQFSSRSPAQTSSVGLLSNTGSPGVKISPFKAYSSVLQSMSAPPPDVNKNFRKPKNVAQKTKLDTRPDHQLSKLERVQKYLAKAQRTELAKKKNKRMQEQPNYVKMPTISLDSSSEEDDDVIEIPVPPPPLVCLDDSSDDSMQAPSTTVTPQAAAKSNTATARASRCSSPSSSIISDDFIAPLDRNCLSDSMDSVSMTEEELRAAKAKTSVAKTLEKKKDKGRSKVDKNNQETSIDINATDKPTAASVNSKGARTRIPLLYKNLIASQKDVSIEHYHEEAANADDVVLIPNDEPPKQTVHPSPKESSSEPTRKARTSSTGDSVYAKGSGSQGKSKRNQELQKTSVAASSDSDTDEGVVTVTEKAKPKRKRKVTSEESEPNSGLSYIHSGEAVSNAQTNLKEAKKKRRLSSSLTNSAQSDTAFMSMISTISQGGEVSDSDSVEMLPSTIEEVTICSSEEQGTSDTTSNTKSASMTFNEFPHESVLKLVPIQRKEVRDPWFISNADKIGPLPSTSKIRCLNCHQIGHIRVKCPMPYRPPVCVMCGESGHLEPRCRKAICLMVSISELWQVLLPQT